MPRLIDNTSLLALFSASFGAAVGGCMANAATTAGDALLVNTIIGGTQGALICGLAVYVPCRLVARSYKLSDLFALTFLVATIIAIFSPARRESVTSTLGLAITSPPRTAGSNPVVQALYARRRITESSLQSAIRELCREGLRQDIDYTVSSAGENRPEKWFFHVEVSRRESDETTLVIDTQVSLAGDADLGTIEPIEIRPSLDTAESEFFATALMAEYKKQNWAHTIISK